MVDIAVNRTLPTFRTLFGGSKSTTEGSGVKRAKTDEKPRIRSQNRFKGDEILTRQGNRGAQVLGRMAKCHTALAKVKPEKKAPQARQKPVVANTQPQGTVQNVLPQALPPKVDKPAFEVLQDEVGQCLTKFSKLGQKPDIDKLATPKERAQAETEHTTARVGIKITADKLLSDVSGQLKTKSDKYAQDLKAGSQPNDPAMLKLESEITELKKARTQLIDVQIRTEFGGLGALSQEPIHKGGAMAALWAMHGPGDVSRHPRVSPALIKDIGEAVDAFNDGAETFKLPSNGKTVDLAGFSQLLAKLVEDGSSLGNTEVGQRSLNELRSLAQTMSARSDFKAAVKMFEGILNETPDFPVGGAVVAFNGALPSLGRSGQRTDPHSLELTASGLRTLTEMVSRGDVFPDMMGIDTAIQGTGKVRSTGNTFDTALAKRQVKRGGEMAVEHLETEFGVSHDGATTKSLQQLAKTPFETMTAIEWIAMLKFCGGDTEINRLAQDFGQKYAGATTKTFAELIKVPFEQMTQKERVALLEFKQEVKQPGFDSAAKLLTDRRAAGERAADLRLQLTETNKTLARLLTADRRRFLKPSTWGDSREKVFDSAPNSIAKDAKLMRALAKFGDSATGRDVAILMAHISELERKTLTLEQQAQGLHPSLKTAVQPDPANPLLHIGITNKDLAAIHVKPEQFKDIAATVERLHNQGVGSVEDIRTFNKSINDVSKLVLKSELTQEMIRSYEGESVRALAEHVGDALLGDADLSYRRINHMPEPNRANGFRMTSREDTVVAHYKGVVTGLKDEFNKSHATTWDNLKTSGQIYNDLEIGISTDYRDHLDVQTSIKEHEAFLADVNKSGVDDALDNFAFNVNPNSPRGLQSAELIIEALKYDELFKQYRNPEAKKKRDAALEKLRGFDIETMRRPWYNKVAAAFGGGSKPDIEHLRKLQQVAEAIIYVREGAPNRLNEIADAIETKGFELDRLLQTRREQNPGAMQHVTDIVRTAVLTEWKNTKTDLNVKDGVVSEGYNPAIDPARKAIMDTLARWGFTPEEFARFSPEIDSVLFSRMTGDDIVQWHSEANWSKASIDEYRESHPERFTRAGILETWQGIKQSFSIDSLLNRKVMDETTKTSLLNTLSGLQEGDKFDLKSGQRITLDSGKIPVDPTGLVGIRARLAVSHLGQFEIERGSDGFKLHLRSGFAGKGNLDAMVGHNFAIGDNVQLSAQGSLGLEAGGSDLTGVSLSFENNENGLRALINLVGKMVDGEKVDLWDWQDATDAGSSLEHRVKLGVNAGATGTMLVGNKGPELDKKQDMLGVGVKGQVSGGLYRGIKENTSESLREATRKGEVEWSVVLGAGVSVYANLYNPMNIGTGFAATESGGVKSAEDSFGKESTTGKDNFAMNSNTQATDLIGLGVSVTASYTDKWKHVTDGNGLFKKCEIVRQSNVRQGVVQAFAVCDTPEMQNLLLGKKPEHVEFAKNFKMFMDLAGPQDFIQVTYGLKEDATKQANELMRRANLAQDQGKTDLAAELEKAARKIVTGKENYIPQKIGLVTTSVKSSQITNLNARYISWSTFSDGKSEHTGATLAIPKPS
jgi:hypothetical protein